MLEFLLLIGLIFFCTVAIVEAMFKRVAITGNATGKFNIARLLLRTVLYSPMLIGAGHGILLLRLPLGLAALFLGESVAATWPAFNIAGALLTFTICIIVGLKQKRENTI